MIPLNRNKKGLKNSKNISIEKDANLDNLITLPFDEIEKLKDTTSAETLKNLSIAYRDGNLTKPDIDKAIEIMRLIIDEPIGKNELIDMLLKRSSDGDLKEAYDLCTKFAKAGDGGAMLRLGRIYRDGKGVEKNIDVAIEWMRAGITKKGTSREWNEYVDLLVKRSLAEDLKEAYEISLKFAKEGNSNSLTNLTRIKHYMNRLTDEKSKGTVIYHLSHYSSLSSLLLLRFVVHRNERACLVVYERKGKEKLTANLIENGLFDEIVFYDERRWYTCKSKELLENDMNEYFNEKLHEKNIDIWNTEEIYCAADVSNSFGIFLAINKIDFTLFDMTKNQFLAQSRYESLYKNKRISEPYYALQKEYGVLSGEKNNCKLMSRLESDYSELQNDRCTKYNLESLESLELEDRKRILNCFDVELDQLLGNIQLVIMNSMHYCNGNSGFPTRKGPYVYQILGDFFSIKNTKLVIKQHPHDVVPFKDFFPSATILDSNFLIELIKICDNVRIKNALSINTTASGRLEGYIDNEVSVGLIFLKIAPLLHYIYVCYDLSQHINGNFRYYQSLVESKSERQESQFMEKFMKNNFPNIDTHSINVGIFESYSDGAFIIKSDMKKISLDKIGERSVIVFIRGSLVSDTIPESEMPNVITFNYNVKKVGNHSLADAANETIHVYTKSHELKEKILSYNLLKEFKYSGIEISVEPNIPTNKD